MKVATRKYEYENIKRDNETFHFLILESIEDLKDFQHISEIIRSKQSIGFWMGFKSQPSTFFRGPMDYAAHELDSNNAMGHIMSVHMGLAQMAGKETSLAGFCQQADSIINGMHANMRQHINSGKFIRAQQNGGYCPIGTDLSEYVDVMDINEQEMYNFLLRGEINATFEITSSTVVIENGRRIPNYTIDEYISVTGDNRDNLQVITNFKLKSLLFKEEDYFNFFNDGIKNHNLTNIIIKTTGQDQQQISSIKRLLEHLMQQYSDRTLNVYVRVDGVGKDIFTTDVSNINITFLK